MSWADLGRAGMLALLVSCAAATTADAPDPPQGAAQVIDLSAYDFPALKGAGFAALRARDPQRAVVFLRAASERRPDDSEVHGALGQALASVGQKQEAIGQLELASRLAPQDIRPRGSLARLFEHLERYDEASAEYEEILKIQPDHRGALGNLGHIGFKTQDYEKCTEYFTRFLEVIEAEPPGLLTERDKQAYHKAKGQLATCKAAR